MDFPDAINDVTDQIFKEVIGCEKCKKAFRILENELIFLRNEKIPIPRICNECRHKHRISDRLTINLYERSCMCVGITDKNGIYKNTTVHLHHKDSPCGEIMKTGYSPESSDIVYCEKCYQAEVY